MTLEKPQSNENLFSNKDVLKKIASIIDELEDRQIEATGEVPEQAAIFYKEVLDLADSVLREKSTTDRESFIRALEFRRKSRDDSEIIDFIIKNTRD